MNNIITHAHNLLTSTSNYWLSLLNNLPIALLNQKPAPQEWSALECLQHLIDVEDLIASRFRVFAEGEDNFPGFNPDTDGTPLDSTLSPLELGKQFMALRQQNLQTLAALSSDNLGQQATHKQMGVVTLKEMVHHWVAHDLNHTKQAEEALMHPFIEGCGPWQRYFK